MANPFINQLDQSPELQALARRQKMAESLIQQSQAPLEGQNVGGIYVAPSWTQGLAQMLRGHLGRQEMLGAEAEHKALLQGEREKTRQEMSKLSELLMGKPSENVASVGDFEGHAPMQAQTQMQAPDVAGAYRFASKSENPIMQQFGFQGMVNTAQDQAKLAQALQQRKVNTDLWNQTGGNLQSFLASGGDATFAKQMAEAPSWGKEKLINVNGQLVGETSGKPVGSVIPKQFDQPSAIAEYEYAKNNNGYKGTLEQFMSNMKRAGAQNMTVSIAGPENQYNKDVGAGLAKESLAQVEAAKAAPELVANARGIKAAIANGAITGTGAEARLAVQKALATAGLVGPGKAANTQELMSGLGRLTLGGVKTSGLGAGNGFTDKDRAFLESAISGQITDTPENIIRVANLAEKVAAANHAKGQKVLQRWQGDQALRNVAQDVSIDEMPQLALPNVENLAAELARRGIK
jgi:hypothetical protein